MGERRLLDESAPLHIAIVSRVVAPRHGFGGLERAVAHAVRHLARRGVRLTVCTQPPYPGAPPDEEFGPNVTWREVPYRVSRLPLRRNSIPDRLLNYPAFSRRLGQEIVDLARRERLDVVDAQGLSGAGYARELRRHADLPPLVINPQGLEEFSRRDWAKALAYTPFRRNLRAAAAVAAAVISTDRVLDVVVQERLRVPAEKVVTIPNGVDVALLDALARPALVRDLRDRYHLAESPLTLLSVARLERNKGLREGLAALHHLRDRLPTGWRWLLVGAGSEERHLRQSIDAYGFGGNVTLLGALPDEAVHALLASADLFLVPSLYEGSSLVALEAMVHRLPVVASAAGGLPDKVRPDETGWLAPPGDPAGLAAALLRALARRADWPAVGRRGRLLVETEFDWARLVERYLALYDALRRGAPPPR